MVRMMVSLECVSDLLYNMSLTPDGNQKIFHLCITIVDNHGWILSLLFGKELDIEY